MNLSERMIACAQLRETVAGHTVTKAVVNQNPHAFVGFAMEPSQCWRPKEENIEIAKEYGPYLTGRIIEDAQVIDANLYLLIGSRALWVDIMPLYTPTGGNVPKRHQLMLELDDGACLTFTGSLGGALFLIERGMNGYAVESGFPSILSDDFSLAFFMNLIKNTELRSLSAKAFLATKNRIHGIDNTILHEILWEARVNPKSKMAALTAEDYERMYHAIKKVIPAVIEAGGLDTQKDIYGQFGGYVTKVSKHTLGKPCAHCGTPIEKEAYLGGAVYYCPGCQEQISLK